jgi:hypothetical protein
MCLQLVSLLRTKDAGRGLINFVNIASVAYNPDDNEGVLYEEAMETIHAIRRDGTIVKGPDALKLMYSTVGWGAFAQLASLPLIAQVRQGAWFSEGGVPLVEVLQGLHCLLIWTFLADTHTHILTMSVTRLPPHRLSRLCTRCSPSCDCPWARALMLCWPCGV